MRFTDEQRQKVKEAIVEQTMIRGRANGTRDERMMRKAAEEYAEDVLKQLEQ